MSYEACRQPGYKPAEQSLSSSTGLKEMQFEWDENKNLTNIAKHGIDFATATAVFSDPDLLIIRSQHGHPEERFLAIGKVNNRAITVVFMMRENRTRIISARRARKQERDVYGH